MTKSDKLTFETRISLVAKQLIKGKNRADIVLYGSENWSVGERQVDKYIAKARETISQAIKKDVIFDYAKALSRYEYIYSKAMDLEDYRLALTVNKEISQLQGLNKIEVQHTGSIEFISNIPD